MQPSLGVPLGPEAKPQVPLRTPVKSPADWKIQLLSMQLLLQASPGKRFFADLRGVQVGPGVGRPGNRVTVGPAWGG